MTAEQVAGSEGSFYRPPARALRARRLEEPRCGDAPNLPDGCGRMLARVLTAPAHIDCPRCKKPNIWGG